MDIFINIYGSCYIGQSFNSVLYRLNILIFYQSSNGYLRYSDIFAVFIEVLKPLSLLICAVV